VAQFPTLYVVRQSHHDSNGRSVELSELASEYGFEFLALLDSEECQHAKPDAIAIEPADTSTEFENIRSQLQAFWPFRHHRSFLAQNVLIGNHSGIEWTIFDCVHIAGLSLSQSVQLFGREFCVVCARVPMSLPSVHLSAESMTERVGSLFGFHDLTFEVEEFNRRYFVRTNDARAAFDILHPVAIDYLLSLPVRDWQFTGSQILIANPGSHASESVRSLMQEVIGFVSLIPEFVVDDRAIAQTFKDPHT